MNSMIKVLMMLLLTLASMDAAATPAGRNVVKKWHSKAPNQVTKKAKKGPKIAKAFSKKRAAALRKWQVYEVQRREPSRFKQRFSHGQS